MTIVTKVSAKGQVVIPKDVRDAMGWPQGTALEITRGESSLTLSMRKTAQPDFNRRAWLAEMRDIVKYDGPRYDDEDWKESIDAMFRDDKDVSV